MKGSGGSPELVYYLSYGSNVDVDRFLCYIEGGLLKIMVVCFLIVGERWMCPRIDEGTLRVSR
jgi:hypothetical protein